MGSFLYQTIIILAGATSLATIGAAEWVTSDGFAATVSKASAEVQRRDLSDDTEFEALLEVTATVSQIVTSSAFWSILKRMLCVPAVPDEPFKSSNRILDSVLGGWNIVPNFSARTGTPFTVFDCTNEGFTQCPRIMYDKQFTPAYSDTSTGAPNEFSYLNLGTFDSNYVNPLAKVSDFGPFPSTMTGRNAFVAPGVWNADLAVHKTFKVTERFQMQLRAEAFNIFNHSNLYIVNGNTDASATNAITATKGVRNDNNSFSTPTYETRNLQLALKLLF